MLRGLVLLGPAAAGVCSIVSCAPRPYGPAERQKKVVELAALICGTCPAVTSDDAGAFAGEALKVAADKRNEWGIRLTPWLNNVLVNQGLNERGLCYQWSRDLYRELADDLPPGFRMTLIQSYHGELREHHAVSLHLAKRHWSKGILLDGWRGAGNLQFEKIGRSRIPWRYEAEHP